MCKRWAGIRAGASRCGNRFGQVGYRVSDSKDVFLGPLQFSQGSMKQAVRMGRRCWDVWQEKP